MGERYREVSIECQWIGVKRTTGDNHIYALECHVAEHVSQKLEGIDLKCRATLTLRVPMPEAKVTITESQFDEACAQALGVESAEGWKTGTAIKARLFGRGE